MKFTKQIPIMKTLTSRCILLSYFLLGMSVFCSGQTLIWSEDFSTYVEGTGIEGPGAVNIGDYPAGVTKWSLDVSGCTLSNSSDYIKTDNERLKSKDLDGPAIWLSESINVSAYTNGVTFSIKFYEYSSMEPDDYIDVHYQLDGGDFVLIPDWNGHGSGTHTLIDDFSKDTVVQAVAACTNLVIKVTFNEDSGYEELQMDDVFIYPNMIYTTSGITQNTLNIAAGKTNRQVIGMEIETTGADNPVSLTSFTINANGSSTPVSNNIENARIWYTGTDSSFSANTQFGSDHTLPTTSNFDITGTQELSEGTNYFWLTFDTKSGATTGEVIDAECISFIINGASQMPTTTAPAGSRTLSLPLAGSYTIGARSSYASFTGAVNDLNELGIIGPVSFSITSGTYTEQISFAEIDGTSANDTITFQSSTGYYDDVTLQFEPSSSDNYVVNFDGSDYISFLDMTIQSTGTSPYGRVIVFKGETQNIILKFCNILGRDVSSTSDDYAVIYGEGGTSNMASNIIIEYDTIRFGSTGIYFEGGDAATLETGNSFFHIAIEDFYYCGIETEYQDAVIISRNTITGEDTSNAEVGIKASYCHNDIEITKNKVLLHGMNSLHGIYLYHCYGTEVNKGLVANNFVSLPDADIETIGIYIRNTGHQGIYHNSINTYTSGRNNNTSRLSEESGVKVEADWTDEFFGFIKIINNIIYGCIPGINVNQVAADNDYLEKSDHNDLFTTGSTFGKWGSTSCIDLTAWRSASEQDSNSVAENPGFVSNTNPNITNSNLYGSVTRLVEVITDFYDDERYDPTTPGVVDKEYNEWNGAVSTDWNDPANWSLGKVPGPNDNVIIWRGKPHHVLLNGNVECNDFCIQYKGTVDLNGHTISLNGDFRNGNRGVIADGTINFQGSHTQDYVDANLMIEGVVNIVVNKSDGSTFHVNSDMMTKDMHLQDGNIDANNKKIESSGNVDFSGGSVSNSSSVVLSGSSTVQFNPGNNELNQVSFTGDGIYELMAKLAVQGNFQSNGTLNQNGHDMEFGGNVDLSGCNYNHGNGKFIVNGNGNQDIYTGYSPHAFFQIVSIINKGKTTRIFTPSDAHVLIVSMLEIATAFLPGRNLVADTVSFYGHVQCNNDFTIGTPDAGGVIVNIMPDYNLVVEGNTTINNSGTLVIKTDATAIFN